MELVSLETFMARTMGGRPNQMNVAPYVGALYECGCGESHAFHPPASQVLRELSRMRLVIGSPDCDVINCVKVKGIVTFKGFKTLFAAKGEL